MKKVDASPATEQAVSDRSLRAFCEAARWGSLTRAAEQLGIGQPAISHAVSRLEDVVGTRLLDRSRSGVSPTEAGARLLDTVAPAFQTIDRAVAEARHDPADQAVRLSVSTSLAGWWLLPRLPEFKLNHPDIEVRLTATDTDFGVDVDLLDLWIPLGIVDRPSNEVTNLCDEKLIPVAAPNLAATVAFDEPASLLAAPLIHLEERYSPRFDWQRWFDRHGMDAGPRLPGDRFNDYSLVIQAALDGLGVALGWHHIVADLVAEGRLVPLAEPMVTDRPFVIVHPGHRPRTAGADAVLSWLVRAMATDTAR
ncbi:MAG: LysR substrate-binding domain-containing protein [Actinomycetota bacterium]